MTPTLVPDTSIQYHSREASHETKIILLVETWLTCTGKEAKILTIECIPDQKVVPDKEILEEQY